MIADLIKITPETKEIKGFTLKLSEPLFFLPGQYVMISFISDPKNKRAFSITEYDKGKNELLLVIKEKGEFTQKLFLSEINEKLNVYGPYGRFILPEEQKPLVFIGGGIGITPLYNMLLHIPNSDYKNKVNLFYSSKTKESMPLFDKINNIKDSRIKIFFNFTEEGKRLECREIQEKVPEFNESVFYICGPLAMIESFRQDLLNMNIDTESVRSEEFK